MEQTLHVLWNVLPNLQRTSVRQVLQQFFTVEASLPGDPLKVAVYVEEGFALKDVLLPEGKGEDRLDTA